MTSERDVLELFERSNPVPDPDGVVVEPDAGRYLADLLGHGTRSVGDRPGTHRNRWLTPMAAAIVAVAGAGLIVLGGRTTDAPAPADTVTTVVPAPTSQPSEVTTPTASVAPEVPVPDLPLLRPGETQATPVGDITLAHVAGDAASLPVWIDFEDSGNYYGSGYDPSTSWRSADGSTWTRIEPTGAPPLSHYVESGGEVWTSAESFGIDQRPQLLRFDGNTFAPIQLPELTEPDVPGLRPDRRSLLLAPFRDELAIIASTSYTIDFTDGFDFGGDIDASEIRLDGLTADTLMLTSNDANQSVGGEYGVAADPGEADVLQIVSPEGTVVGRVGPWPGLDAEQLQQRLGDLAHQQILIGDDTGFETVPGPRPDAVVRSLADVDGQLLAVTYMRRNYVVEEFSLWSTRDLTTWTPVEPPDLGDEIPLEADLLGNGSDAILTTVARAWSTHDAQTWQPLDDSSHRGTFAADFGWVMTRLSPPDPESSSATNVIVSVSSDSTAWQRLPLECSAPGMGAFNSAVVGDKIFVSLDNEPEEDGRLLCVGTVAGS